jgi:ABC-type phosphate transport system permease subunit
LAWGASMLLILMVLFLNIIAKIVQRKWKVQF